MKRFFDLSRSLASTVFVAIQLALVIAPSAHAQQGSMKIHSIDVQYTGPETISRDRILAQMRTKVGDNYSDAIVEQDIRNLYGTGRVQNVRIFGQPQGDGVKVIVAIQTRGVVNEIVINGSTVFNAKTLKKNVGVKLNGPLDEDALGKGKQAIIDLYRGKGYNDVDVQYRVENEQGRAVSHVIYTITEGEKGAISRVHFEGNAHISDYKLRKQMKTKSKTLISFLDKSGRLDESQLQQDIDAIREYYQNQGYIDAEVKQVRRERVNGRLILVIPIVEGPQYHVGKIIVKGAKTTGADKVVKILKIKEGALYSPKAIRDDAKTIADAYGGGGYVDLVVQPQGTPSGPGKIDLTFTIEEGARSFVQRINIVGNTRTKDKVIRREILIAPGDIYSTTRVETSKKRLDNLGYFSRVETYPEDTGVPGRKDLTVQVEEKRTGSLNFGAGFSTIDSVIGFIELTQGNFDLMNWPGFTGAGQKFRARIQFGDQRKDVIIGLTEPYFLDRLLTLGGEAYYREANFLSALYDQRNYGFNIFLRKPINRFMYANLEYRLEDIEIYNVPAGASPLLKAEEGANTKSSLTPSLVFDSRDSPFLSHRGQRIVVTPYVAGGFLGGDTQTYGFDIEGSQYFHLPYDLILLLNGEIQGVDTWGDGRGVPIYDRLFLGGANNLRGFEFRDVSPRDVNDEPIGGRSMARTTVELTFPIVEKIRAAVFFDAGFVNAKSFDYNLDNLATDTGIGLRLDLPIGPIRIDYGFPLQKGQTNASGGRFNFNVGYQF
ncbi:MAG: outer membrane protein assembly factor BamA [Chthoniobacterales bacterium]